MKKVTSTMIALGVIGAAVANAETPDSFSGSIGIGGVFIDGANNLNPNSSEERIDDLNSSPDGDSAGVPALRLDTAWDVGEDKGWKIYFSTTPPIDEVRGFTFDLGATYNMSGVGVWDGGVFYSPFGEVWEDPYLVGIDREESDSSKIGAKIGLKRIL